MNDLLGRRGDYRRRYYRRGLRLLLATGHEGAGIGLAPVTGQLIAGWITGADLPPFAAKVRPGRRISEIP